MRPSVINYMLSVLKNNPARNPVYEIGSYIVKGQEELADLRKYFPGKTFVGCDMREGSGVDRIENVECLTLPNDSVGTMLCLDTLEHVEHVFKAMEEMHRVLTPGGLIIISSVFCFQIHDYPCDYWRFTPKAFELLLKPFSKVEVTFDGKGDFPSGVYGFGIK